jgi:hypothetical protein
MVERNRADSIKSPQIVFIRRVISVPRDDIERRILISRRPQIAAEFRDQFKLAVFVFKPRFGRFKIARIRQDRSRQSDPNRADENAPRNFRKCSRALRRRAIRREISNRAAKRRFRPRRFQNSKFGQKTNAIFLRDDEHFAVGVVEKSVGHIFIAGENMNAIPVCAKKSPQPAIVTMPSIKSVSVSASAADSSAVDSAS